MQNLQISIHNIHTLSCTAFGLTSFSRAIVSFSTFFAFWFSPPSIADAGRPFSLCGHFEFPNPSAVPGRIDPSGVIFAPFFAMVLSF
jgi:hypothetical protein